LGQRIPRVQNHGSTKALRLLFPRRVDTAFVSISKNIMILGWSWVSFIKWV